MARFVHIAGSLLLAAAMLPAIPTADAAAAPAQRINVDGTVYSTATTNDNGSLHVPAAFFRKLGASVQWNAETESVVLKKAGRALTLSAKDKGVFHRPEGTYIPLRHAAQSLGMSIHFDAGTSTAIIRSRTLSDEELYWLHQITEAEAGGEPYEGKVAVAATILNRQDSPDWPNTIKDVIFQIVEVNGVNYYQFSPVLDRRIYEVKATRETKEAVEDALNGKDPTGGATVFYNPEKTDNQWVRERPVSKTIGNHIFSF